VFTLRAIPQRLLRGKRDVNRSFCGSSGATRLIGIGLSDD